MLSFFKNAITKVEPFEKIMILYGVTGTAVGSYWARKAGADDGEKLLLSSLGLMSGLTLGAFYPPASIPFVFGGGILLENIYSKWVGKKHK